VLGAVRPDAESWAVRRALYEAWLDEPDAFVLVGETKDGPVRYALVHMRGPEETWRTGERIAELETLTVLPDHRRRGIGTELLHRVHQELRRVGVEQMRVSVIASNADAVRFYQRSGLRRFTISYIGAVPDNAVPASK
jgi:ribosomal protein S18 acetylase RimI-like enzyme